MPSDAPTEYTTNSSRSSRNKKAGICPKHYFINGMQLAFDDEIGISGMRISCSRPKSDNNIIINVFCMGKSHKFFIDNDTEVYRENKVCPGESDWGEFKMVGSLSSGDDDILISKVVVMMKEEPGGYGEREGIVGMKLILSVPPIHFVAPHKGAQTDLIEYSTTWKHHYQIAAVFATCINGKLAFSGLEAGLPGLVDMRNDGLGEYHELNFANNVPFGVAATATSQSSIVMTNYYNVSLQQLMLLNH